MVASISSPADVLNVALRRIGYSLRVGSLYDGSKAASAALDIYAQTRDELLRQSDWAFAQRTEPLTLFKSAPPGGYFPPVTWNAATNPALPWRYSYLYPDTCLKVRALKAQPMFLFNAAPLPISFDIANDNGQSPSVKVILANVPDAIAVYAAQVTDPAQWEADFVEAIAAALGKRLTPVLVGTGMLQAAAVDEVNSQTVAEREQG